MVIEQILVTHSILVKVFLGFLVGGLAIPFMTANNPLGFRKGSFIYTMIFQGIITMIAFAGIVAVFSADLSWEVSTILMVAIWALMMVIEIKKYKAIKLANLQNVETYKVLKSAFIKISIIQILLVVIMGVMMLLKAKGIVNI
jgi:hypothetical protein